MDLTNENRGSVARIVEILVKNHSGVIIIPENPNFDALAAATGLYLTLLKMGKAVTLSCSSTVEADLAAADKIQNNLSVNGNDLVISFPYSEGSIDKIDYNIQGENFNLIITPREGFPKLDKSKIKYSYTGGSFDFIITIDSPSLSSLGQIYQENQKQFQGKDIINIDRHLTNSQYGTVNFVDKTISSVSELVFEIIQNLDVEVDHNIATNLYIGIATSTNNFSSYSVNANTFETLADLLRLGAIKKSFKKPSTPKFPQFTKPQIIEETQPKKTIEEVEKESKTDEKPKTPEEWLKPKIFKSSGLI